MIVDLKPYPAMKDLGVPWLGKVPENWQRLPGRVCFNEQKIPNTGLRETTVLSLSYGQIVVKPPEKLHGLVPASFETYQIIEPNDIVIRPTDLQNDWNSLRFGFVRTKGIITSAYMCFRTKPLLTAHYGHLLLHAYDLKKIFYGLGSGLRQNLDWRDFKYLPCLVPPPDEQAAIARFLDHADRRIRRHIRAKQKLIKLLEEQKQAIIHRAVTRGLDPNVRLKPSGVEWLGDVPEHWEVWQIGHFSRVGNGSTPSRGNSAYWSGGRYPWLNSSYANQESITQADQFVTETALRECHLPIVPPASVLVAITGQGKTRGKAALLRIEATINQHIACITPREQIASADYVRLALHGAYAQLRAISDDSGSTKGALTCTDIKHFRLALPSLSEQAAIQAFVEIGTRTCSAAIDRAQREIFLLREYRTRLIADVVTGKLDVRAAAASLPDEVDELEAPDDTQALDKGDEPAVDDPDAAPEEVEA
ncbi:MAG: hypothetical protein A3G20_03970 [Acidobacteria bacterium RIFCSPLOWO2_12_FULL_59_11]|nr:MAG: hypothetical protein A3G20_03970 [Acidobacteria bacterium RIFCSPLOWO2_12_FULL_59_11]